jgi:hypothetical protein
VGECGYLLSIGHRRKVAENGISHWGFNGLQVRGSNENFYRVSLLVSEKLGHDITEVSPLESHFCLKGRIICQLVFQASARVNIHSSPAS